MPYVMLIFLADVSRTIRKENKLVRRDYLDGPMLIEPNGNPQHADRRSPTPAATSAFLSLASSLMKRAGSNDLEAIRRSSLDAVGNYCQSLKFRETNPRTRILNHHRFGTFPA